MVQVSDIAFDSEKMNTHIGIGFMQEDEIYDLENNSRHVSNSIDQLYNMKIKLSTRN